MSLFEVTDLAASYARNGATIELFSNVSFSLDEAKIADLVGPSGSGKSTLLRVLALMLKRSSGSIYLDGKESAGFQPTTWRCQVCLVPQTSSLIVGTVKDNLLLPWKFKVRQGEAPPAITELESLLEKAGLSDVELERDASQLSGGQAARVALLRAFATKPKVLLLDEVDAALDEESARMIGVLTHTMAHEGAACLRIRHRESDGFASHTFALQQGTLTVTDVQHGRTTAASASAAQCLTSDNSQQNEATSARFVKAPDAGGSPDHIHEAQGAIGCTEAPEKGADQQ